MQGRQPSIYLCVCVCVNVCVCVRVCVCSVGVAPSPPLDAIFGGGAVRPWRVGSKVVARRARFRGQRGAAAGFLRVNANGDMFTQAFRVHNGPRAFRGGTHMLGSV